MAERPLVSVIVPAYNAARFIGRALASVQEQTYHNVEILVVDDGSKDQTRAIVEAAAARDERITLLRQANRGVAAARNRAVAQARGRFIAPLDADDLWFPKKLERQVRCMMDAGPAAGLVYSWWVAVSEDDDIVGAANRWTVEGDVYEVLVYRNFIGNASVPLFRRACLEDVGGYDATLKARGGQGCEDWDLTLRIAERYDVCHVPAYLSGYRVVKGSMSGDCASMGHSFNLIMEDIERRHPELASEVAQWSRSNFYLYLASVSYNSGNFRQALHWLYETICVDPAALLSSWVLNIALKSTVRNAARPVTSLLWADHEEWLRFKHRVLPDRSEPLSLDRLQQKPASVPESWALKTWKPYDRLRMRRWRRVVKNGEGDEEKSGLPGRSGIRRSAIPGSEGPSGTPRH